MKTSSTSSTPAKKKESIRITSPLFRVSFPNVFKAKVAFDGNDPVFSIDMLLDKKAMENDPDFKKMKQAAAAAKKAKWGDETPKNFRSPFRDGDEKDLDSYKGKYFITAKSKIKPGLVDRDLNEIIDQSEFYAGCWARATLTAYAYDVKGNKGVAFGLQNLQKWKDDTAFSGKKNAKDDFEIIESDDDSDFNASKNSDDDSGDDLDF